MVDGGRTPDPTLLPKEELVTVCCDRCEGGLNFVDELMDTRLAPTRFAPLTLELAWRAGTGADGGVESAAMSHKVCRFAVGSGTA